MCPSGPQNWPLSAYLRAAIPRLDGECVLNSGAEIHSQLVRPLVRRNPAFYSGLVFIILETYLDRVLLHTLDS